MRNPSRTALRAGILLGALGLAGYAAAEDFVQIAGTTCVTPPTLHCPDSECSGPTVINPGPVVEMKSRRTYFLDYPCDLKQDEKVTFILSLHGGGSYANWQRNYFPAMDYKDKYRLVVATPSSPIRVWTDADDEYLRSIVDFVIAQLGKDNIKAFWLVGHSQGGMTSNRIVRTDYFKNKVDGWLSLSGGRLGGNPNRSAAFNTLRFGSPSPGAGSALTPATMAAAAAALREPPAADFSHIYSTGQYEVETISDASDWAKKYSCGAKGAPTEITDTKAGYVYDSTRLNQLNQAWGLLPGPGKATISAYANCKDGRVVADVVRLGKGHTEGYEPKITEELIKLMLSAPGGKIQHGG